MPRLLVINGSLHGKDGNTSLFVEQFLRQLPDTITIDRLDLASCPDITDHKQRFADADGFLFTSGTYWQSWSSHAQRFFEQATDWESDAVFMGKPVGVIITMHSVGGMEVLSRAQSTFNLLGCLIPPQSCIVHSFVNQIAAKHSADMDIWDATSFPIIAHNLIEAMNKTHQYKAWNVSSLADEKSIWVDNNPAE